MVKIIKVFSSYHVKAADFKTGKILTEKLLKQNIN